MTTSSAYLFLAFVLYFTRHTGVSAQTCDPVSFNQLEFSFPGGDDNLNSPTCITIGHDNRLYLGTIGGTVQVLSYDRDSLDVTSRCYSAPITNPRFRMGDQPSPRDILGIAIDPRDSVIRPYVTTNTRFHTVRGLITNNPNAAWRNGAVVRMRPGTSASDPNICLVFDRRIIRNLPVSNENHAVNDLMFSQDGDLLIAVGGSTNMGLPGFRLGNFWESPLSAAVLIARTSRRRFRGGIRYRRGKFPFTAKLVRGDVKVFASGLRNPFTMAMDAVGQVYAADQNSNCGFGNVATTCSDFNLREALQLDTSEEVDLSSDVSFDDCDTSGTSRPDKLIFVERGKFYGHPNIQRGGDECAWIDANTDLSATGEAPPSNYRPQVVAIQSPITGLDLYRGNHFCGDLRGDAIAARFDARGVFRVGVNNAQATSGPTQISSGGGIAFAENAHGELVFVSLGNSQLSLLRPDVTARDELQISGIVPHRHGRRGGNPVIIGGANFGTRPTVSIGGRRCRVTRSSETEIQCIVPRNRRGPADVVVTTEDGDSTTLPNGLLYMNV